MNPASSATFADIVNRLHQSIETQQQLQSRWVAAMWGTAVPADTQRPALALQGQLVPGVVLMLEMARAQHAAGALAGLVEHSLLESSAFERRLASLEQWMLGSWARGHERPQRAGIAGVVAGGLAGPPRTRIGAD